MKRVIYNEDNLKNSDIDEKVVRVKGIFINSNNEVLLSCCEDLYQFPGGHVEIGETLIEAFKREIEEEIGIKLNSVDEPFLHIIHCTKNYRNTGKNRQNDIYYYLVKTEEEPHIDKINFDEYESLGNYNVNKIKLCEFKERVLNNEFNKKETLGLTKEMLTAYEEVLELI